MSIQDGTIGHRKNTEIRFRVDNGLAKKVDDMVSKYGLTKSDVVRLGLYKMFYPTLNGVDLARGEINNAIAKVKNGYQRTAQRVRDYFTEPEDIYMPAYALPSYAQSPNYR